MDLEKEPPDGWGESDTYRSLFEHSIDAVYLTRADGTILDANRAACRMHGMTVEEIRQAGRAGLVLNDERFAAALKERAATGFMRAQYTHVRKDGTTFPVEVEAVVLDRLRPDSPAFVIARDISERCRAEEAHRESEERYARMVATVPGVLYEFALQPDGSGRITYLSPRCPEVFEVDGQAILADLDVLFRMMSPGDKRALEEAVLRAARDRTQFSMEVRITTPSGRAKWIQFLSLPASTSPDGVELRSGLILDITQRKRMEEELWESQEWLELMIEASGGATFWAIPAGRPSYSRRHCELLGIKDDSSIRDFEDFLKLIHPDDREKVRKSHELALTQEGTVEDRLYRCVQPDGSCRWISSKVKARFAEVDGVKRAVRVAGVSFDVTQRLREEHALRESEARYARLAATVPGVIYEVEHDADATGLEEFRYTYLSPRCEELFEVDQQSLQADIVGFHRRMLHPEDLGPFLETALAARRSGTRFAAEARVTTASGRQKWVQFTSVPSASAPGTAVKRTGIILDVTERKCGDEALRESEAALREADRQKNQFLAVLSHELRNPLAPIRNSLYLLRRASLDSEQSARALDVIERQTKHLTRLIDDLLDTTRISHGKIELRREPLDLRALVRRTCDDHRAIFDHRGVSLRFDEPGPLWVDADATRMAQAVGNLLQNSAKFTARGGHTWVSLGAEGDRAVIRVRDDGVGMEPADVERMFEPFAQADSSLAHPHGGLGLGLALVKRLTDMHGGSVEGRSEGLGRGCEFTIALPLCRQPAPRASESVAAGQRVRRDVLIIEDNLDAGESLAEVLRVTGHRVHVALDGRTGITEARRLAPDVVLCDIGLPDVDGYEVARALRADPTFRSTRLVALTGYAQPDDCERAREAGYDAHLAKPASIEEIENAIAPT